MKQYNRIMLGEGGKYIQDCLKDNYIGANFIKHVDLTSRPTNDENKWRHDLIECYLEANPEKSIGTARISLGFLWTICHGLKIGDIVLAPNGEGGYCVAEITGDYYYAPEQELTHCRQVRWLDVTIPRQAMSKSLQNSTGAIGTCCNITKYAEELEHLIGTEKAISAPIIHPKPEMYKERSLHQLLSNYLLSKNVYSKTIFHENSFKSADQAQKWVHPDMVGVEFHEFQETATRSLLKAAETKEYIALHSYELKRTIENDHQLKEYFFQALSNSSWANYGYLVAFEINEDLMEEIARLNRAFGIGIIQLSPYADATKELFPARKNELDYYTIDKLCRINPDYNSFIDKATGVLNVQKEYMEDVKGGLQKFCDKGFDSQEEIIEYCNKHHIPC